MSSRKRRQLSLPDKGPKGQAVVDRLLERVSEPEFSEHNPDGFGMEPLQAASGAAMAVNARICCWWRMMS